MGLLITLVLGLFIVAGACASYLARGNRIIEQLSVSIALGTLATLAIVELLPESIEKLGNHNWIEILICVLVGLGLLKLLDKFIPAHDAHYAHHGHAHDFTEKNITHVGIISAVAVTLHNIIEGMAVYGIAEQSAVTGAMVALGVGLHNIPMGMIMYSTLHDKKKRNIILAIASLSTFAGGIVMAMMWGAVSDHVIGILIAVTLGMIVYIVVFELIPMVLHTKKWNITVPGIAVGILLIVVSTFLE